jgi:hypothetical protein
VWSEISKGLYLFNRKKIQAALVSRITLEDLLLFYRTYLLPSNTRTKFSSQFFGKGKRISRLVGTGTDGVGGSDLKQEQKTEIIVIEDPIKFKQTASLRPVRSYHEMIEVHHQPKKEEA